MRVALKCVAIEISPCPCRRAVIDRYRFSSVDPLACLIDIKRRHPLCKGSQCFAAAATRRLVGRGPAGRSQRRHLTPGHGHQSKTSRAFVVPCSTRCGKRRPVGTLARHQIHNNPVAPCPQRMSSVAAQHPQPPSIVDLLLIVLVQCAAAVDEFAKRRRDANAAFGSHCAESRLQEVGNAADDGQQSSGSPAFGV